MIYKRTKQKGFTLIELLVVVAIISLLASIIFANLSNARFRALDVKKISEFKQVSTALQLYFDKYGSYPNEGLNVATNQWSDNFNSMATQLVSEGFLAGVPVYPNSAPGMYDGYNYYNYGPGTTMGALMITVLNAVPNTTKGIPPSCRPYTGVINWCSDDISSKEYCICNPY